MKKYIVQSYVNDNGYVPDFGDDWTFENLKDAKEWFDLKVSKLPSERRTENQQSVKKFEDNDIWGYELYSFDGRVYEFIDDVSMRWKEVKEGK